VCYEDEAHASFAKEAMANQSLDMDEILNVRYVIRNLIHELADVKVGNRGPQSWRKDCRGTTYRRKRKESNRRNAR